MRTISAVWSSWGPSPQLRTFTEALNSTWHRILSTCGLCHVIKCCVKASKWAGQMCCWLNLKEEVGRHLLCHTVCITVTNSVLHTVERGCRMTRLHLRLTIDSCRLLNIQWIIHRYTSGLRNIIGKSKEIDAKWRDMSKQFLLSNCKLFSAENLPVWLIFSHSTALCLRPQLRSHRTCQADCNSWPLYPPTCRSPLIGFSIGP